MVGIVSVVHVSQKKQFGRADAAEFSQLKFQPNRRRNRCPETINVTSVTGPVINKIGLSRIDGPAAAAGRQLEILVQVDLAGEATKYGAREDELLPIFHSARAASAVRVTGLMLLPPAVDDPASARPFFRALRDVRQRLLDQGTEASMLRELSMGMSHDFEVAIEEGATLVRVGEALFGPRQTVARGAAARR